MVDIELSEDEAEHLGQNQLTKPNTAGKKTKENSDDGIWLAIFDSQICINISFHIIYLDKDISKSFSTYHVLNHLLKAQCNDLIKLGVDPIIKVILFRSRLVFFFSFILHKNKKASCVTLMG